MYNENAHERRLIHALNVRTTKHAERLTARSDSLSVVETVAAARDWSDRRSLSLSIARQLHWCSETGGQTDRNVVLEDTMRVAIASKALAQLCQRSRR